MWDYSIPVIAQVHGWCLAGGTELATACDLVYVAEDTQIGYPPVSLRRPWASGSRATTELQALAMHQASSRQFIQSLISRGVTKALTARDSDFQDYRTTGEHS